MLIERLRKRRTETEAELRRRIDIASRELETAARDIGDVYDHVLVNDDLDTAVKQVSLARTRAVHVARSGRA